jgi:IS30 family transposase
MREFDGDPAVAEADLRRASDALLRSEDELAEAEARAETIEQEPFDGSPEAEAEGDLIVGPMSKSAVATLVDRRSRYLRLVHLPDGHRAEQLVAALQLAFAVQVRRRSQSARPRDGVGFPAGWTVTKCQWRRFRTTLPANSSRSA